MRAETDPHWPDPVVAGAGFTALAGIGAVVWPFFLGISVDLALVTLGALLVQGAGAHRVPRARPRFSRGAVLLLCAGGGVLLAGVLGGPAPTALRGLLVGVGVVLVAGTTRRESRRRRGP